MGKTCFLDHKGIDLNPLNFQRSVYTTTRHRIIVSFECEFLSHQSLFQLLDYEIKIAELTLLYIYSLYLVFRVIGKHICVNL